MNRLKLGLSLASLAAVTGIAVAQPAPPERHRMPREVTRDEARAGAEKLFAAMDLNHDGKLDAADRAVRMGRMFDAIDADHDGKITRAEFLAAHKDGMEHHETADAGGHDGPAGMIRMRAMAMGRQILREADPQRTGTVTHDGFINAALALFDKADANHDGKVTPDERRAAMIGAIGRHRGGGHMGMGRMGGGMEGPGMPGMDMHGDDMMPGAGQ